MPNLLMTDLDSKLWCWSCLIPLKNYLKHLWVTIHFVTRGFLNSSFLKSTALNLFWNCFAFNGVRALLVAKFELLDFVMRIASKTAFEIDLKINLNSYKIHSKGFWARTDQNRPHALVKSWEIKELNFYLSSYFQKIIWYLWILFCGQLTSLAF